jgi:hypothetical protein
MRVPASPDSSVPETKSDFEIFQIACARNFAYLFEALSEIRQILTFGPANNVQNKSGERYDPPDA